MGEARVEEGVERVDRQASPRAAGTPLRRRRWRRRGRRRGRRREAAHRIAEEVAQRGEGSPRSPRAGRLAGSAAPRRPSAPDARRVYGKMAGAEPGHPCFRRRGPPAFTCPLRSAAELAARPAVQALASASLGHSTDLAEGTTGAAAGAGAAVWAKAAPPIDKAAKAAAAACVGDLHGRGSFLFKATVRRGL